MAHSHWGFISFILLVWAAQRVRDIPVVVRRPPAEPSASLDDRLDWFPATLRIFRLGKCILTFAHKC